MHPRENIFHLVVCRCRVHKRKRGRENNIAKDTFTARPDSYLLTTANWQFAFSRRVESRCARDNARFVTLAPLYANHSGPYYPDNGSLIAFRGNMTEANYWQRVRHGERKRAELASQWRCYVHNVSVVFFGSLTLKLTRGSI